MITNSGEQIIEINGAKVNYNVTGTGEPVIMMHGWGCNHTHLKGIEKVVAETNQVFNIDLPGFGKSSEPPTAWTVEDYARMLEEFVKRLNLKSPIVIGHSFGGRIAILYASRNPVGGAVLIDAAGVKPSRSIKYYLRVYSFKLAKAVYPLIVGKEKAEQKIESMRSSRGSSDYNNASPLMRQVLVKAVNTDLRSVMPHIKAPVQLIWGEEDTATPLSHAHTMERLIPNAKLTSFPGAGHFSFIDNPFQTASILRRFLKQNTK